jgi:hypothetical protein
VQIAAPDFDRMFGALADHTRRDIVRAITAEEGIVELASSHQTLARVNVTWVTPLGEEVASTS